MSWHQIPLALGLGSVGLGTLLTSTLAVVRRVDRTLPRARVTASLVVAPTAVIGIAGVLLAAWVVAFVSDSADDSWFTAEAIIGLAAATSGILVAAHLVMCAVARAVTSPRSRTRVAGRVVLCLVAALLSPLFVGLVWLPAIVASFGMREAPLPGASVKPAPTGSPRGTGRPPVRCGAG